MQRKTASALADALLAAQRVQEAIRGLTLEEFEGNWEKCAVVERMFILIGEALVRVRDLEPIVYDRIADRTQIVAFRNRIVHGYDTVSARAVYATAGEPLSQLVSTLEVLVSQAEREIG